MEPNKFKPGDFVYGLLWPTAVVVDIAENGDPIIEAWCYGRAIGSVPARMLVIDNSPKGIKDARYWFKVAVDACISRYGDESRPTHEVSKAIYSAAMTDREETCNI